MENGTERKKENVNAKNPTEQKEDRKKQARENLLVFLVVTIVGIGFIFLIGKGFGGKKENLPGHDSTPKGKTVVYTPEPTPVPLNKRGIKTKAIYITGIMAGQESFIESTIERAKTTDLNAVVIDVKDDGIVNYDSKVPEVMQYENFKKSFDPKAVIQKLHENDIYVIARVACFRDRNYATQRKDLGIKQKNGELFSEGRQYWLNPYKKEAQEYNIAIAKEAVEMGFDEIQFDYVRFPATSKADYGNTEISKVEVIEGFLKLAQEEIRVKLDTPISADVFAIVIESEKDGAAIGQDFEKMGEYVDYMCPMTYPSHWANAAKKGTMSNGVGQQINDVLFTAPDLKPYDVLYNISLKTKEKIAKNPNFKAKIRTYLQDFSATYLPEGYYQTYGAAQVNDQIRGITDAGFEEWILWSGTNQYSYDVFHGK